VRSVVGRSIALRLPQKRMSFFVSLANNLFERADFCVEPQLALMMRTFTPAFLRSIA
jgi:hypothetical protein